jgi:Tol biopolymer transport system component
VIHYNVGPLWSQDGRELAWFAVGTAENLKELFVRDLASGAERTVVLPVSVQYNPSPSWLTIGQSVMVSSSQPAGPRTMYRINPATGESTKVFSQPHNANSPFVQSWSPDGSKAYRVDRAAIMETDSGTGQEKEVHRDSASYVRDVAVSPDGKSLAYVSHQDSPKDQPGLYGPVHIKIVDLASGKDRELVEVRPAWHRRMMTWTPDGKHLIYATESYAGNDQPTRLWLVAAAGGTPVQLGKDFDGRVFGLVVSPDGKQLGFDILKESNELFAIEGLFAR